MHKGSIKNKLMCRFALNTSFVQKNVYEFTKQTVDPDSTSKNPKFHDEFKIEVYFRDYCNRCEPGMDIDEICKRC